MINHVYVVVRTDVRNIDTRKILTIDRERQWFSFSSPGVSSRGGGSTFMRAMSR